jgi:peroxiredoxin
MFAIRPIVAALAVAVSVAAGAAAYWATAAETVPSVPYTLLDGTRGDTGRLNGKVVLINFWATSCVTCMKEMPQIVATHRKYRAQGYDTLAVAMSYDPPAYVARYAETRGLPFGVAIDNTGAIARRFGDVQITPTTLLVNRRGEIVKRFVGEPDFAALHQLVEKLLAEG